MVITAVRKSHAIKMALQKLKERYPPSIHRIAGISKYNKEPHSRMMKSGMIMDDGHHYQSMTTAASSKIGALTFFTIIHHRS